MSRIGTKNLESIIFYRDTYLLDTDINNDIPEEFKTDGYLFRKDTSKDFDEIIYSDVDNKYCLYITSSSNGDYGVYVNIDVFSILKQISAIRALNNSLNGIDFYFFDIKDSVDFDEFIEEQKYTCPCCGSDLRECGMWTNVTQFIDFSNGNNRFEHDEYSDSSSDEYYCRNCDGFIDVENFEIKE